MGLRRGDDGFVDAVLFRFAIPLTMLVRFVAFPAVTALAFVPSMEHKVDGEMLRALLPDLVAAATTRLRRRPRVVLRFRRRLLSRRQRQPGRPRPRAGRRGRSDRNDRNDRIETKLRLQI